MNIGRGPFWFSVRKASDCLYSRRKGKFGTRVFGWSICLRLFGRSIL